MSEDEHERDSPADERTVIGRDDRAQDREPERASPSFRQSGGGSDSHNRLTTPRAEGEEGGGGSEGKRRGRPFHPQIPSTASPSKASQVMLVRFRPGLLARGRLGAFGLPTWLADVQAVALERSGTHRSHLQRRGRAGIAPASLRPERLFPAHCRKTRQHHGGEPRLASRGAPGPSIPSARAFCGGEIGVKYASRAGVCGVGMEAEAMDFALSIEQQEWHDAAVRFAREELSDEQDLLGPRRTAGVLARGLAALCPVRHPGVAGARRVRRQGTGPAGHDRGDGGTRLRLPRQRPDLRDQRVALDQSRSRSSATAPRSRRRRYLPGLCDGTLIGANGASEVEAGSDIFSMHDPGRAPGRLLGPRSAGRPGSPAARWPTSSSATQRPTRPGGSWASAPSSSPGTRPGSGWSARSRSWASGRSRWASWPSRIARSRPTNLLGREGRGAEVFNCSMEWERGAILASTLGTMRRQLERCIDHARHAQAVRQADRQVPGGRPPDRRR